MDENQILAQYGRTMRSAQRLEGRIKILLNLYKLIAGTSKSGAPLPDEDFEALLLAGNQKTFGQALHGVLRELSRIGGVLFPEVAEKGLWETVRVRTFLAHHYFQARGILIRDETARMYLIAELQWFSEVFDEWGPTLDRWVDQLFKAIDINEQDLKDAQELFAESIPDIRRERLTALKSRLEKMGIEVPPVPRNMT